MKKKGDFRERLLEEERHGLEHIHSNPDFGESWHVLSLIMEGKRKWVHRGCILESKLAV